MGVLYFFFFFQAEDGIRDLTVTGVQTCALPICHHGRPPGRAPVRQRRALRRPAVPGAGGEPDRRRRRLRGGFPPPLRAGRRSMGRGGGRCVRGGPLRGGPGPGGDPRRRTPRGGARELPAGARPRALTGRASRDYRGRWLANE